MNPTDSPTIDRADGEVPAGDTHAPELTLTRPSGRTRGQWRETAGSGTVLAFSALAVVLAGAGIWVCILCLNAAL
ncbi:hypothetical protein ACTHAM_001141 [Cellulomonas soli]|uniref:hypothetical protein n=1 Tax=Cellulomonas soli TaxID=931535 RepID=UPI003F84AC6E